MESPLQVATSMAATAPSPKRRHWTVSTPLEDDDQNEGFQQPTDGDDWSCGEDVGVVDVDLRTTPVLHYSRITSAGMPRGESPMSSTGPFAPSTCQCSTLTVVRVDSDTLSMTNNSAVSAASTTPTVPVSTMGNGSPPTPVNGDNNYHYHRSTNEHDYKYNDPIQNQLLFLIYINIICL